ncbi:MAG: hypothetical protein JO219_06105 [Candidatus Eremiobacteraeota bacterium]|nr:hypothetical protein [Candidatus Eremiobacteraeota bacterium]MBV8365539.1 hypothetical protein [Candidatus Eremiobacteraeota bacterium]
MDTTPGVVKRLLRNLYHPVALRRDPLANAIRLVRRRLPAPRAFDEADIRLVQRSILSWVTLLDAEQPTHRGEAHRKRQRVIIERYDVGGHQRASVASELGISLRQFYRERHAALERIADMIADEMLRAQEAAGFEDGAAFGRAV